MKNKLREIKLLFAQLGYDHQQAIVDYANFLVQRYKIENSRDRDLKPESIERPGQETVIAAIKRLKKTYAEIQVFNDEVRDLNADISNTILLLKESEVESGHYYIQLLDSLREIAHCLL
ncbi:MAG: hypothetical protein ACERLB_16460, partial [Gammaproteobacteria bacterium]